MKTVLLFFLANTIIAQSFNVNGHISIGDTLNVKYAKITFIDQNDNSKRWETLTDSLGNYEIEIVTNIKNKKNLVPQSIELEQNYPNPFSRQTTISYKLNSSKNIEVKIYDILGQQVRTLQIGNLSAGNYNFNWTGTDDFGRKVSKGIYFYQLSTDNESIVKKMLFIDGQTFSLGFSNQSNSTLSKDQLFTSSNTYTIEVINGDSTNPWIKRNEVNNIVLELNTTLDFTVKEDILEKYYLFIGNRFGYIMVYDTERHKMVDSIGGFKEELWDIEVTNGGRKLYVCTKRGPVNAPGYVYAVDMQTRENEVILAKSAEIFMSPQGVPFIVAENPYDTLRHLGIIDTVTNYITWIDTLDIYGIGASDQGLVFDPIEPIIYSLSNDYKLFKYNYLDKVLLQNYQSINYYYDHMVMDPKGKYIYCAGGPAIDIEKDSIVGTFRYAIDDHNGSISLSTDGYFLCTTDPGGYLRLFPLPTGKVAIFNKLPEGFYSDEYYFIDITSTAKLQNTGYITDKIFLTNNGRKAFVSDWGYYFYILDIKDKIVTDIIKLNYRMGPSRLVPKNFKN